MATITAYKCTRANGRDFYSNEIEYAVGTTLVHPDPEMTTAPCGRGFHVSPTAKMTCHYGRRDIDRGKWRWFEVQIDEADILARDDTKLRVRQLSVIRELTVADVFGAGLAESVTKQRAEVETWRRIPWLRPAGAVGETELAPLCMQLHEALTFWLAKRGINRALSRTARIISDRRCAIDTADRARRAYADVVADDAGAAAVVAAAAAADAVVAAAAAANVAAAAAANGVAAAAAAAADALFAADAVVAAAAADADAVVAAAVVVDDAAAAAADASWVWWYLRPHYVLWRHSRFLLAGMTEPNPFAPIVAMYRLGALPLGWVDGEFCIYVPECVAAKAARRGPK